MRPILNLVALLGLASNLGLPTMYWGDLPGMVPVHFGFSGVADRWGPKWNMFLLPLVALGIYIAVTLAVRIGGGGNSLIAITRENAERQRAAMMALTSWIMAEVVWLFVFIEWRTIQVAIGRADGLSWQFLPIVVLTIFGTIGYYIWRCYQLR